MTVDEIHYVSGRFGDAARRAVKAGCDFVGIHGAHGYLISQFFSPFSNKREDEYGGDLLRRMRFPLEIVAAVREAIGPEVPIVYRMSGNEHQPAGGVTLDDACALASTLEAAGVDLIDVSAGMYETNWWITQPMEMPQGVLAGSAKHVRNAVSIPVSVSGRITDPRTAEYVIESGCSDFVTLGRALHADPEFPNKAREGRLGEICTCIACNQGCSDIHAKGQPIRCVVNTMTGREREYSIRPSRSVRKVVVVGGGPAGLEAARILAMRGCVVTLFEKEGEPGGQMLLNRWVPDREQMADHLAWLTQAATRTGVSLRLGIEATVAMILAERADSIVIATGSAPGLPPIPGIMDGPIVNPYDVIRRPVRGIKRALVIGGGIRGVGVARLLAARGTEVVLTEPGAELVTDITTRSRRFQIAALRDLPNVSVQLGTTVEAIGPGSASLWNNCDRWIVEGIDLVVPTHFLLPVTEVADALYGIEDTPPIYLIGDVCLPRGVLEATSEAAALAHRL